MGREVCGMCHYLGSDTFCDFYDCFYMKCEEVKDCPDDLDEDDYEDEDEKSDD